MEIIVIKRLLILAIIIAIAVFSASKLAHNYYWDVSQNSLNALSPASKDLLDRLDADLHVIVSSPDKNIINFFDDVLNRYDKYSSRIHIQYNTHATAETISIEYKNQKQTFALDLQNITEQQISTLIQKVVLKTEYWLVFLTGHGELDPFNDSVLGLSNFTDMLKDSGIHIAELNLLQQQTLPRNIDTLVLLNPQTALLPMEQELLHTYLQNGGNLWVFTEPDAPLVDFLQTEFGVTLTSGVIVDPASLPLGSPHPALKLMTQDQKHTINNGIHSPTVMPWSAHLQITHANARWEYQSFLKSSSESWTYTGPETMDIDVMRQYVGSHGPLDIGLALHNDQQRIILLGDSSFITNKYLSMYANRKLVSNMLQWLDAKPTPVTYANTAGVDFSYCPSKIDRFFYNYVWIFIMPFLLFVIGFCIRAR